MYGLVKLLPTLLSSLSALVNRVYRCPWILLLYHAEDAGPRPTHSPNPSADGFILPSYSSLPATPAPDTSPGLRAHVSGDTVCPHLRLSCPDYLPIFIPGTVSFPSLSSFCAPPLHDYTIFTVASFLPTHSCVQTQDGPLQGKKATCTETPPLSPPCLPQLANSKCRKGP